jgi:hypothetical protein
VSNTDTPSHNNHPAAESARVDQLERALRYLGERQTALEERIPPLIEHSVKAALTDRVPSADAMRWIQGAIREQAERAAIRRAIIEKTLTGLVWLAVIGLGAAIWDSVRHNLWIGRP